VSRQPPPPGPEGGLAVLKNRPFLLLWLSQVVTQIGANMVLYGLTVIVLEASDLSSAVSGLFLTFLLPSVIFSAVAGVYVDRLDGKLVLIVTNIIRAALLVGVFAAGHDLALILLLNILFATTTVFFAPAEAAMIPFVVPRDQLVSANGLFTLTLNGAFALGFALLGPLIVTIFGRPEPMILIVAGLYGMGALFCMTLPANPPAPGPSRRRRETVVEAGQAVGGVFGQLREGIAYIRSNPSIGWSLSYLGIAASLVGVIGVLGPSLAEQTLGLSPKDLVVVVLPLGLGIVFGVMLLNNYGRYFPRRHAIEGGLIALGLALLILTVAGPLSRFLRGINEDVTIVDLSGLTSLVAVVIALAFVSGIAYGIVAIASQTQLQEDLPADVRGRVFGVLNMLVSVSSILPIIIVGPISDLVGTTAVIIAVSILVLLAGLVSILRRGRTRPEEAHRTAGEMVPGTAVDPIGVAIRPTASPPADRPEARP
jgi:MFS family permease